MINFSQNQTIINCINCQSSSIEKTKDYLKARISMIKRSSDNKIFHKSCRKCRPDKFKNKFYIEDIENITTIL